MAATQTEETNAESGTDVTLVLTSTGTRRACRPRLMQFTSNQPGIRAIPMKRSPAAILEGGKKAMIREIAKLKLKK